MRIHLEGLTVLRGIAAIWVVLHHAFFSLEGVELPNNNLLAQVIERGWLGVDLFFILSGFILSHSYNEKLSFRSPSTIWNFVVKRFARIYPAHIFVLCLFGVIVSSAMLLGIFHDTQSIYTTSNFLTQALMLNGLGLFPSEGWNVATWSISSEFFAYMLFPFSLLALKGVNCHVRAATFIALLICINIGASVYFNSGEQYMLGFEFALLRVLSEFLMGMGLYRIYLYKNLRGIALVLTGLGLLGIFFQGLIENRFYDFMYSLYFILLILGLGNIELKRVPFFSYLGEISYSLYLVHSLVIILVNQVIRHTYLGSYPSLSVPVLVFCSIFFAGLIYRYIEVPGRRATIEGTLLAGKALLRRKSQPLP